MGDQSQSFPGANDIQKPNDKVLSSTANEVPKNDDPKPNPDQRPLVGSGRRS